MLLLSSSESATSDITHCMAVLQALLTGLEGSPCDSDIARQMPAILLPILLPAV